MFKCPTCNGDVQVEADAETEGRLALDLEGNSILDENEESLWVSREEYNACFEQLQDALSKLKNANTVRKISRTGDLMRTEFWEPEIRYCIAGTIAEIEKRDNHMDIIWVNFPINPDDGRGLRHFSLPLPMDRDEVEEFSEAESLQFTISHCYGINK